MAQGVVAREVAIGVVELLEIVQVEQGHAQRRAAAVGARAFALEHVVQAATVEAARQLVFAHQFAHVLQLRFQILDARLRFLHFLVRGQHAVARRHRLGLHELRLAQHFFQHLVEFLDVAGTADALGKAADLFVEIARRRRHGTEAVDERHHHVLDGRLDVRDAVFQLPLLVDDVLQAARRVFQRAVVERAGDQVLHGGDLAAHPAVVVQQFGHVFQQQFEEAQQQFLLLGRVAALQFDLVAQVLQACRDFLQRFLAVRGLDRGAQRFRFAGQVRRARKQRRDGERQRAAEQVAQQLRFAVLRAQRHGGVRVAAQVFLGQLRQRAGIAVPVALLDGAVEAGAELGQFARRVGQLVGESGQHVFRAGVKRRDRRQDVDAGDLVIDLAVGVRRRRDAPRGETAERFACDFRRVQAGRPRRAM